MGFHADNYPAMGPIPFIISLSFGASRQLIFKNIKSRRKILCIVESGSVVVMVGQHIQEAWLHGLPKQKQTIIGERWNMSFRYHSPSPFKFIL